LSRAGLCLINRRSSAAKNAVNGVMAVPMRFAGIGETVLFRRRLKWGQVTNPDVESRHPCS